MIMIFIFHLINVIDLCIIYTIIKLYNICIFYTLYIKIYNIELIKIIENNKWTVLAIPWVNPT